MQETLKRSLHQLVCMVSEYYYYCCCLTAVEPESADYPLGLQYYAKEIGWEEHLQNDLFYVMWDMKP